jgi:Rrf2 family protein
MQISVKTDYALLALLDLASQPSHEPVRTADIARRQKIPRKFLELILAGLKSAGFVESRRGAEGGYLLARRPGSVTIGEVLRALDGPSAKGGSRREPETPFTETWRKVDAAVSEVLDHTTFADLLREWNERQLQGVRNWDI